MPESKNFGLSILKPRTIEIHQFTFTGIEEIRQVVEEDTLSSDLLPGFNLDVAAIFER